MGEHRVLEAAGEQQLRVFTQALLDDVRALERMLESGGFETGRTRIGAEQEMFLVDARLDPAPVASAVIERAGDRRLTSEIGRFNLEANLTPRLLSGRCLRDLHAEIDEILAIVRRAAAAEQADVVLTGILPTLRMSDLHIDNMTPAVRYQELNRAMKRLRGEDFHVSIDGLDELDVTHDNVMFEACNTSFQVHVQVDPGEFAHRYNLAQAITAPLLAIAENSPLLLDRRLWAESRIALFQESTDERSDARQGRGHPARVGFGNGWVEASALEIFREDVARFRVLLARELDEDPAAVLERGGVPELSALRLHTGTVWRWNRACYGVLEGRPHLRIEHRALPAGPTPIDEVANAALFFGLVTAPAEAFGDVREHLAFDDAKANFLRAAREGSKAQLVWLDGRTVAADDLVLSELLPVAREALAGSNVDRSDVDRYLGVVAERVRREQTGARWMLRSLATMEAEGTPELRSRAITRAMRDRQRSGRAVHTWELASVDDLRDGHPRYTTVGQLMTTDVFTVRPGDVADLARSVMDWRDVRHVPVEDEQGRPAGLVTPRSLLRLYAASRGDDAPIPVSAVMEPNPPTVSPDTPLREAIAQMQAAGLGCLLVVEDERLAGIVTDRDFVSVSAELLRDPPPCERT
ncbi:MAG: hypothetical protein QOD06_1922 [Candidatus Binatota bacterium]|nr:hypothetical protein [Candidatus Binatota bacterium]